MHRNPPTFVTMVHKCMCNYYGAKTVCYKVNYKTGVIDSQCVRLGIWWSEWQELQDNVVIDRAVDNVSRNQLVLPGQQNIADCKDKDNIPQPYLPTKTVFKTDSSYDIVIKVVCVTVCTSLETKRFFTFAFLAVSYLTLWWSTILIWSIPWIW